MEKILHFRPKWGNPKKRRPVTVVARAFPADNPEELVVVAAWARVGIDEKTKKLEQFCREKGRSLAMERLDNPMKDDGVARLVFHMNRDASLIESMVAIANKVSKNFRHYHERRQKRAQ